MPDLIEDVRGRRVLAALTHPDDEIAMCVLLRRISRQGGELFLSWTHSTDIRRREAEGFADRMNVPADRRFFHGAPDGGTAEAMPDLLPRFDRMMQAAKPDRVLVGAFEQGHLDHDATHVLVRRSFRGPVYEVPFYHSYLTRLQRVGTFAGEGPAEEILLGPEEREFKKAVARGYPSQTIYRLALLHEIREIAFGRRPRLLRR
ncbi:MAG: hypothetical protein C4320_10250, partial [Armatimonadota bacterium]